MLQPRPRPVRQSVALMGAKRAGFRYNRRDIQFDELFEAVSPGDADILVKAKLARHPTPTELAAKARARRDVDTAAAGDDRSRTAESDAGIPAPEVTVLEPKDVASSDAPPELRADPTELPPPESGPAPTKKKRVRKSRARKPATVGDPPASP